MSEKAPSKQIFLELNPSKVINEDPIIVKKEVFGNDLNQDTYAMISNNGSEEYLCGKELESVGLNPPKETFDAKREVRALLEKRGYSHNKSTEFLKHFGHHPIEAGEYIDSLRTNHRGNSTDNVAEVYELAQFRYKKAKRYRLISLIPFNIEFPGGMCHIDAGELFVTLPKKKKK